jgi:hypothetical protein
MVRMPPSAKSAGPSDAPHSHKARVRMAHIFPCHGPLDQGLEPGTYTVGETRRRHAHG